MRSMPLRESSSENGRPRDVAAEPEVFAHRAVDRLHDAGGVQRDRAGVELVHHGLEEDVGLAQILEQALVLTVSLW